MGKSLISKSVILLSLLMDFHLLWMKFRRMPSIFSEKVLRWKVNKLKRQCQGIIPEKINKQNLYLVLHIIMAARITYAQYWKNERIPSEEELIKKILECADMDRLTMRLKDKEETEYYQSWNLFYKWLEERTKE